jgi:starch synthase
MDILLVTPELAPYAQASRAGDSVAALAKALGQLEHRVTIAVPRYPGFETGGLLAARRLTPLKLEGGAQVTVLDGQLPSGPTLVLFDAPGQFDRPGVYGEKEDYADNAERFGLLSKAAVALVQQRAERGEPFDVVHLADAATAAAAVPLRRLAARPAIVVGVHDGSRRGVVPEEFLGLFGIDPTSLDLGPSREKGGVSLLALGAEAADAVTAVSPALATDLSDSKRFGALASVVARRPSTVFGVLSGLDYAVFNPATDPALKARFDAEDPSNKGRSKADLLRTGGLDVDTDRPLVVAILEAGPGGGGDLLVDVLTPLLKNDVSLAVVARGDEKVVERLSAASDEFSDRFFVEPHGDETFLRKASAAADIVFLPGEYDPTGLWARIAQRYGALPVARATGAHVDAVVDCDAELETGTGFLFDDPRPDAAIGALARALAAYDSGRWPVLRRRVMRLDLSWDRPARRYVQVYRQAAAARPRGGT